MEANRLIGRVTIETHYTLRIGETAFTLDEHQAESLLFALQGVRRRKADGLPEPQTIPVGVPSSDAVAFARHGAQWSWEESERLKELLHTDKTYAEIGTLMGRTAQSIQVKTSGDMRLYAIRNPEKVSGELHAVSEAVGVQIPAGVPMRAALSDVKDQSVEQDAALHLSRSGNDWTDEEDAKLRVAMESGGTLSQVSLLLKRSGREVQERWRFLSKTRRT
jgi:hypothetical protein